MASRKPRAANGSGEPFVALETRLGYRFRNAHLLRLALTHRSYSYESRGIDPRTAERSTKSLALPGDDNEQLEFLGDAVLGLLVAEAIFKLFPQCGEGELTRLRAALVSRKRMAEVGFDWKLGEHLLLGASAEQAGGRAKPALHANAAEAVIAAIYLDGGLDPVRTLVETAVVAPEMAAMRAALEGSTGGALRDHKTLLQERAQATGAGRLRYIDVAETGPAHQRRFTIEAQLESSTGTLVLAQAEATTKKEAQQLAAEMALRRWPELVPAPPAAAMEQTA